MLIHLVLGQEIVGMQARHEGAEMSKEGMLSIQLKLGRIQPGPRPLSRSGARKVAQRAPTMGEPRHSLGDQMRSLRVG
jgi:hypothetical protein